MESEASVASKGNPERKEQLQVLDDVVDEEPRDVQAQSPPKVPQAPVNASQAKGSSEKSPSKAAHSKKPNTEASQVPTNEGPGDSSALVQSDDMKAKAPERALPSPDPSGGSQSNLQPKSRDGSPLDAPGAPGVSPLSKVDSQEASSKRLKDQLGL